MGRRRKGGATQLWRSFWLPFKPTPKWLPSKGGGAISQGLNYNLWTSPTRVEWETQWHPKNPKALNLKGNVYNTWGAQAAPIQSFPVFSNANRGAEGHWAMRMAVLANEGDLSRSCDSMSLSTS